MEPNTLSIKDFVYCFFVFFAILSIFNLLEFLNLKMWIILFFIVVGLIFIKKTNFLFYLFIISLPFMNREWGMDLGFSLSPSYIFFGLVLVSFCYNKIMASEFFMISTPIDVPLFLFASVSILSVFQTAHVSSTPTIILDSFRNYPWIKGLIGILMLFLMYLVYYLSVNLFVKKDFLKNALYLFLVTAVMISLYTLFAAIFVFFSGSSIPSALDPLTTFAEDKFRFRSFLAEPLFFGSYLLVLIPVIYSLLISKTYFINKKFLWFVIL